MAIPLIASSLHSSTRDLRAHTSELSPLTCCSTRMACALICRWLTTPHGAFAGGEMLNGWMLSDHLSCRSFPSFPPSLPLSLPAFLPPQLPSSSLSLAFTVSLVVPLLACAPPLSTAKSNAILGLLPPSPRSVVCALSLSSSLRHATHGSASPRAFNALVVRTWRGRGCKSDQH